MSEQEAEVLLQIPSADLDEIVRPPNAPPSVGQRVSKARGVELLVLSLTLSEESMKEVQDTLGVHGKAIAARPNEPIVVLLCGEYKLPVTTDVPARRSNVYDYMFQVPDLAVGITLGRDTPAEVLEAFEFIIKTYGTLTEGTIPSHDAGPAPAGQASRGLAGAAPMGAAAAAVPPISMQPPQQQQQQPPQWGQQPQQAQAPPQWGQVPPQQQAWSPPPIPEGDRPPQYGGATLEEQQKSARAAAMSAQVYVTPRAYPGSQTRLIETMPSLHRPPPALSTRIAHGLGSISRKVSEGLHTGSNAVAGGISHGTDTVVANTERTQDPVHVPDAVKNNLRRSRVATKGAVAVSGGFAAAVVGVTSVISDQVANRLRPAVPHNTEPSKLDGVKEVGIATVGAAAEVTSAAMEAARTLLTASCDGVTKVVTHKLGDEAGQATSDGLGLAQDAYATASNVRQAGLKSVAKTTAKATAQKTFN